LFSEDDVNKTAFGDPQWTDYMQQWSMETSLYSLSVQKYSSLQTQENYYMVFASFLAGILVLLLIPQRGFFLRLKIG
jgi:hypothetical protein